MTEEEYIVVPDEMSQIIATIFRKKKLEDIEKLIMQESRPRRIYLSFIEGTIEIFYCEYLQKTCLHRWETRMGMFYAWPFEHSLCH